MKNYFLRHWYKWFGEPSSAKAAKSMQKSLRKLNRATEYQAAKADTLTRVAEATQQAAVVASNEAAKAIRVRDKLKELFEI
jgi:hypothetical protein